jgi:hypothetical protein
MYKICHHFASAVHILGTRSHDQVFDFINLFIRSAFGKPARDAQHEGIVGAVLGVKVMAGIFDAKVCWMPEAANFGAEEVAVHEEMGFVRSRLALD